MITKGYDRLLESHFYILTSKGKEDDVVTDPEFCCFIDMFHKELEEMVTQIRRHGGDGNF